MVKYVYTLGASDERIKVEELDRTVEYTYDSLYRLTSETITKGKTVTTYAYEYDNVSNRTLKTVNGVETVYTYNELNQLVSEDSTTYEYDNAGNLVRVVGAGKTALYVYNADNKLVKATVQQGNNVVVETYTYDYVGNRTSKTTTINNHVEKVYYLNDNSSLTNVLAEYSASGDEICYYTVGADLVSQEINGKVYAYLYDGHGTVRALANENGKITDTYTYDAFGNLISSTGSTANSYRYCGEQFDSTTGLYYLRARYMNPSVGRFISMDTYQGSNADPISLHKYLYANSNPVTYTDPSGFYADNMAAAAGMAILDQTVQLNAIGIFNSIMAGLAITLTPVVGTLLTQYLLLQIDNIAAGKDIYYSLYDEYKKGEVKNIPINKQQRPDPNRIYYVYFLADNSGQIAYVGRTKNMEKRMQAHDKTSRGQLHLVAYAENLTYDECRWVEQGCILGFNTLYDPTMGIAKSDYIGNRINGISPLNKNIGTYGKLGYTVLRIIYNEVSNEVLNLIEGGKL